MRTGVECNYTTYHSKKIVSFLEVLEDLNAVFAKAYSSPALQLHFKLNLQVKNSSSKNCLGETMLYCLFCLLTVDSVFAEHILFVIKTILKEHKPCFLQKVKNFLRAIASQTTLHQLKTRLAGKQAQTRLARTNISNLSICTAHK